MAGANRRNIIRRIFTRKAGAASDESGLSQPMEILIAALLGIAAIMTAFAGYKAALADGDTLAGFQEGSAIYDDANQQYLEGNQQIANDINVFTQYAIAGARNEEDVVSYIREGIMDDRFIPAVEEWEEADGDLPSPFEAKTYENKPYEEAEKLVAEGDKLFEEAGVKDEEGDKYTLATVVLAVALFFGGVAGVTRSHLIAVAMTLCTTFLMIASGAYMLTI